MNPFYVLVSISGFLSFHSMLLGYMGHGLSFEAESIGYSALTFGIAWWAYDDAARQKYWRPYEFGAFMLFGWPILLPVYIYQTRHWSGVKILLIILTLYWLPSALGWAAYYANPANA
jgi:hypothetical protein